METDEELESGYGTGTPRGDNLHNDYAQGLADAYQRLATARGHRVGAVVDGAVVVADSGTNSLFGNVAIARRPLRDTEWAVAAQELGDFYEGHAGGPYMLFSAWPTLDLRTVGFGQIGHPPLMVRPSAPLEIDSIEGFEIRRVDDAETARDWEWAIVHGYPDPGLQPFEAGHTLPERALGVEGWSFWVGYLDGEPAGTSAAIVDEHHVGVEMISTMDAARGRGVGRALTATATLADSNKPAMLISSDLGKSVYDRLGYITLLRYTLWMGHRS